MQKPFLCQAQSFYRKPFEKEKDKLTCTSPLTIVASDMPFLDIKARYGWWIIRTGRGFSSLGYTITADFTFPFSVSLSAYNIITYSVYIQFLLSKAHIWIKSWYWTKMVQKDLLLQWQYFFHIRLIYEAPNRTVSEHCPVHQSRRTSIRYPTSPPRWLLLL